jgi:hypothetical protein
MVNAFDYREFITVRDHDNQFQQLSNQRGRLPKPNLRPRKLLPR